MKIKKWNAQYQLIKKFYKLKTKMKFILKSKNLQINKKIKLKIVLVLKK